MRGGRDAAHVRGQFRMLKASVDPHLHLSLTWEEHAPHR